MLTLSRKQMTVLFLVLISFIVVVATSMMVLHAVNPSLWQHVDGVLPDMVSHW